MILGLMREYGWTAKQACSEITIPQLYRLFMVDADGWRPATDEEVAKILERGRQKRREREAAEAAAKEAAHGPAG